MKIGRLAKAIAHKKAIDYAKKGQFGPKNKNAKNMRKSILQEHSSCAVQKTARKRTKYSRNETILKISHVAKAIANAKAFSKMDSVGQKMKMSNTCEKQFWRNIRVVLLKKPVGKTANIGEMANFENQPVCKGYTLCKNGRFGSKIKNAKNM